MYVTDYSDVSSASASWGTLVIKGGIVQTESLQVYWWFEGERHLLAEGTDYTVSWRDSDGNPLDGGPTQAGTYDLVVSGIGEYHGEGVFTVDVRDGNDISLARADYDSSDSYLVPGGAFHAPSFTLTLDGEELPADAWELVGWRDENGQPLEGEPSSGGWFNAVFEGRGDYSGTLCYQLSVKDFRDVSNAVVSWGTFAIKDGVLLIDEPVLRWSLDGKSYELIENIDYLVSWRGVDGNPLEGNPTQVGMYNLVITGIGDYYGEYSRRVAVTDQNDIANVSLSYISRYVVVSGNLRYGEVCLWPDSARLGPQLKEGIDYSIAWVDAEGNILEGLPHATGSYTVKITGIGAYHGCRQVSVYVYDATDISGSSYTWSVDGGAYLKAGAFHMPYIKQGGIVYAYGIRPTYDVSWLDADGRLLEGTPTSFGEYTMRMQGTGEFIGTVDIPVNVVDYNDISDNGLFAAATTGDGFISAGKFTAPSFTLSKHEYDEFGNMSVSYLPEGSFELVGWQDADGGLLEADPTEAGEYLAVLEGRNGFTGTRAVPVTVSEYNDLSSCALSYQQAGIIDGKGVLSQLRIQAPDGTIVDGTCWDMQVLTLAGTPVQEPMNQGGEYRVVFSGKGDWRGTLQTTAFFSNYDEFWLFNVSLGNAAFYDTVGVRHYLYTGEPIQITSSVSRRSYLSTAYYGFDLSKR